MIENPLTQEPQEEKVKSPQKLSKLIGTFFRNGLKSNLDLTSLADTKAGILISINGFILTVSVTASSFAIHNSMMTYAFISIIITSLGSIILAVLAVRPRTKNKLVAKEYLEGYESILYYQDMADMDPKEYIKKTNKILKSDKKTRNEMISHLHILGAEIKKKYFWLKKAYTFFSLGLVVSALIIIYALAGVEKTPFYNFSKGNIVYKVDKFHNIFEPSGVTTLSDGKILIVEDDGDVKSLKLVEFNINKKLVELGNLYIPKKLKKRFKKVEDLEAVTSKGDLVYAITSHSLNREHQRKKAREKLILFQYDDGSMVELFMYGHLKEEITRKYPELFKNLFNIDDLNIEGLAIDAQGRLLIGLRAPLSKMEAIIIRIKNPREVLMEKQPIEFEKPVVLDLDGLGIRDITYDKEKKGFWIIAGDSNERGMNFKLYFWDEKDMKVRYIRNQPDIGFSEGITVVKTGDDTSLFIVEDDGKKPNLSADYIILKRDSL